MWIMLRWEQMTCMKPSCYTESQRKSSIRVVLICGSLQQIVELQGLIDAEEHGISVSEMPTETFVQYTLGRGVGSLKSCQQKVLWTWTRMR